MRNEWQALRERLKAAGFASNRRRSRRPRLAPPDGLKTMREAAARLGCSEKTLKGHLENGEIGYVAIGHGTKRPRRMFTDADIDAFIANRTRKDAPCPSIAPRARHTSTSISSGEVIDFTVPRKPRPSAKPKK
jgi:excisionase family DNA binding protein